MRRALARERFVGVVMPIECLMSVGKGGGFLVERRTPDRDADAVVEFQLEAPRQTIAGPPFYRLIGRFQIKEGEPVGAAAEKRPRETIFPVIQTSLPRCVNRRVSC